MKITWMKAVLLASILALFTGCGGDSGGDNSGGDNSGGGGDNAGVAGTWNGTGNYEHNNVPIRQFNLNLSQNGNAVSGSYTITRDARPTMTGSISGSVSGNRISMTMNPHGMAEGSVSGNSMSLDWIESGFGGADFTGSRAGKVQISR